MKVAILAGGAGTRLAEETEVKPKPMVEIGGMPILMHIMKHYAHYGFEHFVIALGYKGEHIKKYFVDYCSLDGNLTVDLKTRQVNTHGGERPNWTVELVDTGTATMTGGRIKRLAQIIGNETFMMTLGDGVSDVNIEKLLAFHRAHGKLTTMTAVRPPARFGHLEFVDGGERVLEFTEKPQTAEGWINGAFFVLEPGVFDYIEDDQTTWEHAPLQNLAREGQLVAYKHESFWQCMDTLRDKYVLERLWNSGNPPWKTWR